MHEGDANTATAAIRARRISCSATLRSRAPSATLVSKSTMPSISRRKSTSAVPLLLYTRTWSAIVQGAPATCSEWQLLGRISNPSARGRRWTTSARVSFGHIAEFRQPERCNPRQAALDEHFKLRGEPLRLIEASQLNENHVGEALQIARVQARTTVWTEITIQPFA